MAQALAAEAVICTIPLPVLRNIPADFSPPVRTALAAADYMPAGKVAFQAERRFWELDDQIYGGLSWTTRDITQIWYPSAGLQQAKGILVGAYIWSDKEGDDFAAKAPARRLAGEFSLVNRYGLTGKCARPVSSLHRPRGVVIGIDVLIPVRVFPMRNIRIAVGRRVL